MPERSRFVTLEGGEGVGKTHLIQGLKQKLESAGQTVLLTREPGGTPLGDAVRSLFMNPPEKPTPLAELFLISAARHQHIEAVVRPALEAGQWVLCDRFYDSTYVYQGDLGGVARQSLQNVIDLSVQGCHPGLTFVLDCPVDVAMGRVKKRAKDLQPELANRYDEGSIAMYETLRQGYLKQAQAEPERIALLDSTQTPEHVLERAWSQLRRHFPI